MSLMDRLEDRLGSLALPRLMSYVAVSHGVLFFLRPLHLGLESSLVLDSQLVLQGQVWRLLTFLLIPVVSSPLWLVFYLMFIMSVGTSMEMAWGTFRFNAFYWLGALGIIAGSFLVPGYGTDSAILLESLFLAFATTFPDAGLFLFMIIPVRAKWLGLAAGGLLLYQFLSVGWLMKAAMLASLSNYIIFVGFGWFRRGAREAGRRVSGALVRPRSVHACAACGMDEIKDPDREFRFCSDCEKEYCMAHLENHGHA